MAKAKKADDIKNVIECVANILRYNLKKLDVMVTLEEEIEIIRNYIYIQKMRFGDKIEYLFSIDEEALGCQVPSMIIQPFVENSVIHGLEPMEGKGIMELSVENQHQDIVVTIKDNGLGIDETTLEYIRSNRGKLLGDSRKGIGVNNVIRRLELIYGKNVVDMDSKLGEGTTVKIHLKNLAEYAGGRYLVDG